jgi:hypothetical protein
MAKGLRVKTAQVNRLPHDNFSFEAYDFQRSELSERYDRDRVLVVILEGILRMDAENLKRKANHLPGVLGRSSVCDDLIHDLKAASEGFEGLSMLFECAAARLTVINAKLV